MDGRAVTHGHITMVLNGSSLQDLRLVRKFWRPDLIMLQLRRDEALAQPGTFWWHAGNWFGSRPAHIVAAHMHTISDVGGMWALHLKTQLAGHQA